MGETHPRLSVTATLLDVPHAVTIRFIPDGADAIQFFVIDQFRSAFDHMGLIHLVGNFGHNNSFTVIAIWFNFRFSTHHNPATTGFKGILYTFVSVDGAAGRSEEHTSELQSLMRISYAVF